MTTKEQIEFLQGEISTDTKALLAAEIAIRGKEALSLVPGHDSASERSDAAKMRQMRENLALRIRLARKLIDEISEKTFVV